VLDTSQGRWKRHSGESPPHCKPAESASRDKKDCVLNILEGGV
jgi:hypothetical protein